TDAEELSFLLTELFPARGGSPPAFHNSGSGRAGAFGGENRFEPPVFAQTLSQQKVRPPKIMPRMAAFAAALFLCSFGLGMQSPRAASQQIENQAKRAAFGEPRQGRALFMPPLFGSIVVDAAPKPAPGELWINGKKEAEFLTPHQLSDIDLKEEKVVEIILEGPDKKKTSEKFVLNAANPSWAKTFQMEPPKPGVLKVAARPWGEVTIPGVVSRKETPVSGLNLQEGRYHLQVVYPPTGKAVEKEIVLASGARLICQADFGSVPKLVCK
ncbi:MAG: hypothetical protein U1D33_02285, partial [bacterium]|nr:hypothetical protein [bacterium]